MKLSQCIRSSHVIDSSLTRLCAPGHGITDIDIDPSYLAVLAANRGTSHFQDAVRSFCTTCKGRASKSVEATDTPNIAISFQLVTVLLARNNISTLLGVVQFKNVVHLSLQSNSIKTIETCEALSTLEYLAHLSLEYNPVSRLPNYRPHILRICASHDVLPAEFSCRLKTLDSREVTSVEVVQVRGIIQHEYSFLIPLIHRSRLAVLMQTANKRVNLHRELRRRGHLVADTLLPITAARIVTLCGSALLQNFDFSASAHLIRSHVTLLRRRSDHNKVADEGWDYFFQAYSERIEKTLVDELATLVAQLSCCSDEPNLNLLSELWLTSCSQAIDAPRLFSRPPNTSHLSTQKDAKGSLRRSSKSRGKHLCTKVSMASPVRSASPSSSSHFPSPVPHSESLSLDHQDSAIINTLREVQNAFMAESRHRTLRVCFKRWILRLNCIMLASRAEVRMQRIVFVKWRQRTLEQTLRQKHSRTLLQSTFLKWVQSSCQRQQYRRLLASAKSFVPRSCSTCAALVFRIGSHDSQWLKRVLFSLWKERMHDCSRLNQDSSVCDTLKVASEAKCATVEESCPSVSLLPQQSAISHCSSFTQTERWVEGGNVNREAESHLMEISKSLQKDKILLVQKVVNLERLVVERDLRVGDMNSTVEDLRKRLAAAEAERDAALFAIKGYESERLFHQQLIYRLQAGQ